MSRKSKSKKKTRPPLAYHYNPTDWPTEKKPLLSERIGSLLNSMTSVFSKMPRRNFSGNRSAPQPQPLYKVGFRPYYGPTTVGGLFAFILFIACLAGVIAILNVTGVLK